MPLLTSLNLAEARSSFDVLARVADQDAISVVLEGNDGDILWAARRDELFRYLLCARPHQLLNRIPGMMVACEKLATATALSAGCPLPFWPRTWTYRGAKAELLAARIFEQLPGGARAIVKPSRSSKGIGILIASDRDELYSALAGIRQSLRQSAGCEQDLLRVTDDAIIQQYVDPPLLLGGLKFDLRLYVLVCPAEEEDELGPAFLCREGLARFCTKQYAQISDCKADWVDVHLTNTSVSMTSATYQRASDIDDGLCGSKRKVSLVLQRLEESGVISREKFWKSIEMLVSTVLRRLTPTVYEAAVAKETYATPPIDGIDAQLCAAVAPERFRQAFGLLGFDVLLDADAEPFLMEVNAAPSLSIDDLRPVEGLRDGIGGQRPGARSRWAVWHGGAEWGQRCRCPDMAGRHVHDLSAIDLDIKSTVARGALKILQAWSQGERPANCNAETEYTSLHNVPTRFL